MPAPTPLCGVLAPSSRGCLVAGAEGINDTILSRGMIPCLCTVYFEGDRGPVEVDRGGLTVVFTAVSHQTNQRASVVRDDALHRCAKRREGEGRSRQRARTGRAKNEGAR